MKKPRDRRAELLRHLNVSEDDLAGTPLITLQLKESGTSADRLVDVLRGDDQPESLAFVQAWDALSDKSRKLVGIEAIALSCGLSPRRLWELFKGASLTQGMESTQVMLSESIPKVMRRVIKTALTAKGEMAQERLFKAARVLPTPHGNVTVIRMPKALEQAEEEQEQLSGGDLESADDFMLKASRAMNPKALPPAIKAEPVEVEE